MTRRHARREHRRVYPLLYRKPQWQYVDIPIDLPPLMAAIVMPPPLNTTTINFTAAEDVAGYRVYWKVKP